MSNFNPYTEEIKTQGGKRTVFCCKCRTEHGEVILKAHTLEALQAFYKFSCLDYNPEESPF